MRRIKTSLSKSFPPLSLFAEDLKEIAAVLAQNDGKLSIKTAQFEYETIDELLANNEDPLAGLSMSRETPYISVDFYRGRGAWLYASSPDLASKGIFAEIQTILESKCRKSHLFIERIVKGAAWFGALGGGMLAGSGQWKDAALLWLLIPLEIIFMLSGRQSSVSREFRSLKKSFLKRNSDQILVAVVGAIAGAIVTLVVTALTTHGKP